MGTCTKNVTFWLIEQLKEFAFSLPITVADLSHSDPVSAFKVVIRLSYKTCYSGQNMENKKEDIKGNSQH